MTSDVLALVERVNRREEPACGAPACGELAEPVESDAASAGTLAEALVCTAANVAAELVCWLWKDVIARDKIAVVAGAANVGKSLLVAGDFAARVSTGTAWPDGSECEAGDVLIASGHDNAEDTLVPRLCDHGADLRRVHFLQGVNGDNDGSIMEDWESWARRCLESGGLLPALWRALRERAGVKMVVIDPVSAFLDVGKAARSRVVWSGLQELARESGAAFVLVTHLRAAPAKGTLVVGGSDGLVSAARMVWVVTRDPADPQRRLFVPAKNNLGGECPGFAWRLADGKVQWETGRVECGPSGELVDEVSRARGQREALAAAFIADFLAQGPRMWVVVEHHAKLAGHRPGTLERVRSSVAQTFKRHEEDGRWLWRLIGDDRTSSEADIEDLFGGGPIGLVASGRSGKCGKARKDSDATGETDRGEEDEDSDDDDDE